MNFHILTLFPDMVERGLNTSIIGRAVGKGLLNIETINIRDYTLDRHKKVDDYPYGGGAGMVMQAQPIYDAWQAVAQKIGRKPRTVYLTPQGNTFQQEMAKDYAKEEDLVLLCGHYEGIDERVLEEIVTDYVSIGQEEYFRQWSWWMRYPVWCLAYWQMMNPEPQNPLKEIYWNIRSIADRKTGWERKFQLFYFPETMQR